MPDENKLAALEAAGFKVRPACASCVYFSAGVMPDWGTCSITSYDHKKHRGPSRDASVPSIGWCHRYVKDDAKLAALAGAHVRFYDEED